MLQRIVNLFRYGLFKTNEETEYYLFGRETYLEICVHKEGLNNALNLIEKDIRNIDDKRSKEYKDLVKNKHICNNKLELINDVLETADSIVEPMIDDY